MALLLRADSFFPKSTQVDDGCPLSAVWSTQHVKLGLIDRLITLTNEQGSAEFLYDARCDARFQIYLLEFSCFNIFYIFDRPKLRFQAKNGIIFIKIFPVPRNLRNNID